MTSPQHSPVELWYSHRGGATATGLAVQKGWLQEAFAGGDTDLRALEDAASRDIRLAYYHHGQTGLVREGGNIAAIWARSEGQSAVVIGITWVDEYQGILVRRDSGIRTLADLRGKRLGLPLRRRALIDLQRASAQRGFVTALELAGLDPRMAKWVHVERPDFEFPQRMTARDVELDALRAGHVDAIFLRGAQGYAAVQDPALHEVIDLNRQEDPLKRVNHGTPRPITVDRAFLDRHPEIVRRYLAVLVKAARWAASHGDEVPALIAADVPGHTAAEVAGAHGPQLHRSLLPSLRPSHVAALAEMKRFLLEWRYIDHDFDVAQWIDPAPLADVLRVHHPDSRASAPQAARWPILKEHIHVR